MRPDTLTRLLDALAVLLVRLHLAGFSWGDCSLSNTLFRRDAGRLRRLPGRRRDRRAAQPLISEGQRAHDLDIAQINISGEMLDLEAGGLLHAVHRPGGVRRGDLRALPAALGAS